MDVLPVNFKLLQFCGVWEDYKDGFIVRFLKFCHRYAILITLYHFTLCEIIESISSSDDIDNLTECLFVTLTFVTMCFKFANFLYRKKELSLLLSYFRAKECKFQNSTEKEILDEYSYKAKWSALSFMCLAQTTGLTILVVPILTFRTTERQLPTKMYVPYSVSGLSLYLVTYLEQIVAITYGILLNVTFDSLVYGLTIQTCGQVELLKHRLTVIFENERIDSKSQIKSNVKDSIRLCVRHHVIIREIVRRIQSIFVLSITVLFFCSLITLCTSIFQMSKKPLFSPEFLSLSLYLSSMLFQVFCYCWFGNELHLKSKSIADAVYASDWTNASFVDRRSLMIVMGQQGLILSYYGIFAMVLHTFTWILKTSYSTFSLLQQMSD